MKIHNPFRTALVATLGVGIGIALINGVQTLTTVLLYVGTALFLSLGLEPVVNFLTRKGMRRWISVLVTVAGVLGVFAGIISIVLPVIINQVSSLITRITMMLTSAGANPLNDFKTWLSQVFPYLDVETVLNEAQSWLLRNMGDLGAQVVNASLAAAQGLFGAFIVLILTIYFTASIPSLKHAAYQLVPASKRTGFSHIAEQITDSVGHYVIGQVSLGLINGVLSFIFLTIVGAPFPAVLAVLAFCGSLIPLVGTLTSSTLIVLTCLIPGLGSPTVAITAAIYYLIYMQVESYLIAPRIMSRAVAVPGALVVIAALSGGALGGLLGALVAIPVAASLLIIYRQRVIPAMNER